MGHHNNIVRVAVHSGDTCALSAVQAHQETYLQDRERGCGVGQEEILVFRCASERLRQAGRRLLPFSGGDTDYRASVRCARRTDIHKAPDEAYAYCRAQPVCRRNLHADWNASGAH